MNAKIVIEIANAGVSFHKAQEKLTEVYDNLCDSNRVEIKEVKFVRHTEHLRLRTEKLVFECEDQPELVQKTRAWLNRIGLSAYVVCFKPEYNPLYEITEMKPYRV